MSSITAQQIKLDLQLVPKEKRLEIGKCNGRLTRVMKPREPTFKVVLDALALTPCYSAFLITADVPKVDMHQFWNSVYKHDTFYRFKLDKKKTFASLINKGLSGKTTGLDKLHLSRAQILWGMYYQKNVDYVELLWEDFIYQIDNRAYKKQEKIPEKKETKAYKIYLGFATGATPPKIARKFKKASPSKKDLNLNLVAMDEEPKSAKTGSCQEYYKETDFWSGYKR
ncbi:hypothetical protein Tco_1112728 [Tanacetum coccineum]|uniref:Uncharacterized protein n=1 Tax=Tanacetum coccineum TaxID=301880 RepID=A0ABQ5IRM6_9ASTR